MTGSNDNDREAWRALTDDELRALAPFTLRVEGLSDDAVRRVRVEYERMLSRAVSRFVHHLDRAPDQREAELIAKAIVEYLNAVTIPLLGGRGGATLQ